MMHVRFSCALAARGCSDVKLQRGFLPYQKARLLENVA
jgi:hypothetical protein